MKPDLGPSDYLDRTQIIVLFEVFAVQGRSRVRRTISQLFLTVKLINITAFIIDVTHKKELASVLSIN